MDAQRIKNAVRSAYASIARADDTSSCCSGSCCGAESDSRNHGYSREELSSVPEGADLGLGCGNPQAIARLLPGQTVLDLGSGGGLDCFLAAQQVGSTGLVIGVDMTPEMVARARKNARETGATNVEFRLGEIEHLPVADGSVDVVISNCVVNLAADKRAVFREAHRVLRPGGRLAITDVIVSSTLPEEIRNDMALHAGCLAGAATIEEHEQLLVEAGFVEVRVRPDETSRMFIRDLVEGSDVDVHVISATIEATRP